jgi:hypothetical protein
MYHSFIVCVYVCVFSLSLSTSLHPFFFLYRNYSYNIRLNFRFYPLYVLNRSSFNNMRPYLSFTLSYTMNVNDVLYSVTIYILHSMYAIASMYVCCVFCVYMQISCALLLISFSHASRNFS